VEYRRRLTSTFFDVNLYGYFHKLTAAPGDTFLLGVFSTPSEVALYGIAQQIVRAVVILQNNIQAALTPEVVTLWSKSKVRQLYRLAVYYSASTLGVGAIGVLLVFLLAGPVVVLISKPDYLDALPVFYVLVLAVYISLSTLPFYAIALSMDMLRRRNIALLVKVLLMGFAILSGLGALKMGFVQLLGAVSVVVLCDLPVCFRLRRLAHQQPEGDIP
jgi:O-antigen/teichoic acid export membrane protein